MKGFPTQTAVMNSKFAKFTVIFQRWKGVWLPEWIRHLSCIKIISLLTYLLHGAESFL